MKTICSNGDECDKSLKTLETNLSKRGYPAEVVKTKIDKAKGFFRSSLLRAKKSKKASTAPKAPFVVTRNPRLPP